MNRFIDSFNYAIEGFIYVMRTQRNMCVHFLFAIFLFPLGIVLDFTRIELICLGIVSTTVLFAEMINTAMEHTIDLISDSFHPLARVVKDICAGAVLLTAISAIICGYLLFSQHLDFSMTKAGINRLRSSPFHITIIAIIVVFGLVVLGKGMFRKGTPLRGGMPSGHTAMAFVIWTIIAFSTSNPLIISLSFIMALAIARSRLNQHIHTLWEVSAGALLGFLATLLLIQVFQ